ncbi:glycosyltransferase [Brevibacillus sp. 179-C9.3 HS]|uniref:glycosyltransferase n=1 Tax=unclassified Brevibacillus TaxID=2684853 RepID=UPI0039A3E30D
MPRKIRVLFVVPNLSGGGAERVVVTLLRHFNRQHIEPILMVTELKGPYVTALPPDIPVIDLQVSRVRYALPKMVSEINRLKPDVVMSTLNYMNMALLSVKPFLKSNPKLIVREANTPTKAMQFHSPLKKKIFTRLYQWQYPQADAIITQSDGMRNDLLSFLPQLSPHKVVRIYNPLDVDKVIQDANTHNPFQKETSRQIIAAGRLTYQKGFDLLLHAFQKVVKACEDVQLQIMGEGPLREDLANLAISLGVGERVTFRGFQTNPYPYMKHADLFILSSRWEGFPNILLEALACGRPVVAMECPSGPQEILAKNKYGLLIPDGDVERLADGIIAVLNGEHRFMSGEERARMFEAKVITEEYEKVFMTLS